VTGILQQLGQMRRPDQDRSLAVTGRMDRERPCEAPAGAPSGLIGRAAAHSGPWNGLRRPGGGGWKARRGRDPLGGPPSSTAAPVRGASTPLPLAPSTLSRATPRGHNSESARIFVESLRRLAFAIERIGQERDKAAAQIEGPKGSILLEGVAKAIETPSG
jgi:hypothetical protein